MSQDIINNFIDSMRAAGCEPHDPAEIVPDGEDHYYRLAGDKRDKRGGYCLTITPDGFSYGNYVNFKTGDKGSWYSGKGVKSLSAEERKANEARYKALETARKAKVEARHKQSAFDAGLLWAKCKPVQTHDYLLRKGIQAHGARIDGKDLIYPGYLGGKIVTYQRIAPDGGKLFLAGGKKQGCYYPLTTAAEPKDTIIITEGIATAASIREACGLPVLAAFDAGNLQHVAKEMRGKYPKAKIILAADNDHGGEKNTGILSAQQAAAKVGGFVVWPEFEEGSSLTDFNDLHMTAGLDAVKDKILSVLTRAESVGDTVVADPHLLDSQSGIPDFIPDGLVPFDAPESGKLSPVFDDKKISNSLIWKKWPSDMDQGKMEPNSIHNILVFMRHKDKYQGLFRYDRFAGRVILAREPFWHDSTERFKVREIRDSDISYMTASMEKDNLAPSGAKIHEAINVVAQENWIDPPLDYFNALKWDGVERHSMWLHKYLGAGGDRSYLAAVGSAFLIAIVARQFSPGCKAENMLVLEGPQGLLKSSALRALADVGKGEDQESYFCDTLSFDQLKDKDSVLKMQGKTIIEIPDLAGLSAGEIEDVKARMSIEVDEIRVPYGRTMAKFPRRFVWAGSTNESHWLKDQTGNRRFWPVDCGVINIDALREDREQLIAEAVYKYKNKAQWWIGRDNPLWKTVESEQADRLLEDAWYAPIFRIVNRVNFITLGEIFEGLKIDVKDRTGRDQKRIIDNLKRLGFRSKKKRVQGEPVSGWERVGAAQEIIEPEFEEIEF